MSGNLSTDGGGMPRALFDEGKHSRLIEALRAGNFLEAACDYAGVHKSTVYRYLQEAKQPDCDQRIVDLAREIQEARASAEIRNVAIIQTAARRHWQAAAWFLERAHQTRWGGKARVELTGADGGPVQVDTDPRAALLSLLEDAGEPESP